VANRLLQPYEKTMAPVSDMKAKEARAAILREWFALAPDQRATTRQAAQFADKAQIPYNLPANGNANVMIRGWLAPYIGLNPFDQSTG
jgi:hypothetical protein